MCGAMIFCIPSLGHSSHANIQHGNRPNSPPFTAAFSTRLLADGANGRATYDFGEASGDFFLRHRRLGKKMDSNPKNVGETPKFGGEHVLDVEKNGIADNHVLVADRPTIEVWTFLVVTPSKPASRSPLNKR